MSDFMHSLVEELRAREQYLEEHSDSPIFDNDTDGSFKRDYDKLQAELKDFAKRLDKAQDTGEDFDEHFEREIKDEHQKLSVRIDSWSKKFDA